MNRHKRNARLIDQLIDPAKLSITEGYRYWYRQFRRGGTGWNDLPTNLGYSQALETFHGIGASSRVRSLALERLTLRNLLKRSIKPDLFAAWLEASHGYVGVAGDGCSCPMAQYVRSLNPVNLQGVFVSYQYVETRERHNSPPIVIKVDEWLKKFIRSIDCGDSRKITREEAISTLEHVMETTNDN